MPIVQRVRRPGRVNLDLTPDELRNRALVHATNMRFVNGYAQRFNTGISRVFVPQPSPYW